MDALQYSCEQFDSVLGRNRVALNPASRTLVQAAIAFPDIQRQVDARLKFAKDSSRMTKVMKSELGGLARSFASFITDEIRRGGATERDAIVAAFERWRKTRAFTSIAGRFHTDTRGAGCAQRL